MTGHPLRTVCLGLGVGRATAYRGPPGRPVHATTADDATVYAQVRAVLHTRGCYGYRRVTVVLNRTFGTHYNRKRLQRVRQLTGLVVPRQRRRVGARPHRGRVIRPASNERWCGDAFEIACWDGGVIRVACVRDCQDRECLAYVAAPRALTGSDIQRLRREAVHPRFGTTRAPVACEWLTDNGAIFTALPTVLGAEQPGLVPITTPIARPASTGMAEAFVQPIRRDYLDGAELLTPAVLRALPGWIADCNTEAPPPASGCSAPWLGAGPSGRRHVRAAPVSATGGQTSCLHGILGPWSSSPPLATRSNGCGSTGR